MRRGRFRRENRDSNKKGKYLEREFRIRRHDRDRLETGLRGQHKKPLRRFFNDRRLESDIEYRACGRSKAVNCTHSTLGRFNLHIELKVPRASPLQISNLRIR